jgi:AcrR family transcriptional regulator
LLPVSKTLRPMSVSTFLQSLIPQRPSAGGADTRARKGDVTRAAIVDAAISTARRQGLESLTIGALAEQLKMSKSGLFAHFGSREELQLAVLKEYALRFVDEVLRPAVRKRRGLPRLQAVVANWLKHLAREVEQGCLMIGGAVEYDDCPGPLQDAMVAIIGGWNAELVRAIEDATETGELRANTDPRQLAFDIHGVMLAFHLATRLLHAGDSYKRARSAVARLLNDATAVPARSAGRQTRSRFDSPTRSPTSPPAQPRRRVRATVA